MTGATPRLASHRIDFSRFRPLGTDTISTPILRPPAKSQLSISLIFGGSFCGCPEGGLAALSEGVTPGNLCRVGRVLNHSRYGRERIGRDSLRRVSMHKAFPFGTLPHTLLSRSPEPPRTTGDWQEHSALQYVLHLPEVYA